MKKSLKFSDIYIAYLPLVVFFLNLLYGLLNIEGVGDTDSRYNLFFAIFGFIPTILEETNRIINAQVSRGSDFNEGNLAQKVRKFIPILIPLFIATLKRADELATAMEVRGYSTTGVRSKYKVLKYNKLDYLSYILIIVITIFIMLV